MLLLKYELYALNDLYDLYDLYDYINTEDVICQEKIFAGRQSWELSEKIWGFSSRDEGWNLSQLPLKYSCDLYFSSCSISLFLHL